VLPSPFYRSSRPAQRRSLAPSCLPKQLSLNLSLTKSALFYSAYLPDLPRVMSQSYLSSSEWHRTVIVSKLTRVLRRDRTRVQDSIVSCPSVGTSRTDSYLFCFLHLLSIYLPPFLSSFALVPHRTSTPRSPTQVHKALPFAVDHHKNGQARSLQRRVLLLGILAFSSCIRHIPAPVSCHYHPSLLADIQTAYLVLPIFCDRMFQ